MNAEPHALTLGSSPPGSRGDEAQIEKPPATDRILNQASADVATDTSPSDLDTPQAALRKPHLHSRRNGNVARLPKTIRDKINLMLQDGLTYAAIIDQLGEDGKGLVISNLSRWKDGGYQDWLLEQSFITQ